MSKRVYLAIDLGAESGRVMAGLWNGRSLQLEEIHRFANTSVRLGDSLRWDVVRLWYEIQNGVTAASRKYGRQIVSVGADAWGVDFVLLTKSGELAGQPCHYRDARTNGVMERAFKRMPRAEIYAQTGLQFMQINTLYQLLAIKESNPELLETADCLLMMPDFIHWALCGSRKVEYTIGSTSQCLNPVTRKWSSDLLKRFGLPERIFPKLVMPGAKLGKLRGSVSEQTGLKGVEVVAPPAHDTASAVAGVPTANTGRADWAYISSGTWSLMGLETQKAVLSRRALELNMTNEGGVDGTCRLLKNIMGLWLVQQCRKSFESRGGKWTYAALAQKAARAPALRSLVNPDDSRFFNPPDMAKAIRDFCRATRQPVPRNEGEFIRCAYESLALKYRQVLGHLEELAGNRVEVIHVVGGGSQSVILNQFTADACEREVIAGPVEATAMGNLLVQIRADGELGSLAEMREVVRRSAKPVHYLPRKSAAWREAAEQFSSFQ